MNLMLLFFFITLCLTNCTNHSENVKVNEKPINELKQEIVKPSIEVRSHLKNSLIKFTDG